MEEGSLIQYIDSYHYPKCRNISVNFGLKTVNNIYKNVYKSLRLKGTIAIEKRSLSDRMENKAMFRLKRSYSSHDKWERGNPIGDGLPRMYFYDTTKNGCIVHLFEPSMGQAVGSECTGQKFEFQFLH